MAVLRFPKRHSAASVDAKPNRAGSGSPLPRSARAAVKIKNFSVGIAPRAFQLLTADNPTPASAAVAEVPPIASMTESTVVSITHEYSQYVNKSSLHNSGIFTDCELRPNRGMSRAQKDLAYRLKLTQEALGLSGAQLCKDTGIGTSQWSQFVDPIEGRQITVDAVYLLKDEFGVTFEWVYDGDRNRLPADLKEKIREKEREGQVDLRRKRGRPPKKQEKKPGRKAASG